MTSGPLRGCAFLDPQKSVMCAGCFTFEKFASREQFLTWHREEWSFLKGTHQAFREGETRNVDVTLTEMPKIALPIVLEMFRVSCFE